MKPGPTARPLTAGLLLALLAGAVQAESVIEEQGRVVRALVDAFKKSDAGLLRTSSAGRSELVCSDVRCDLRIEGDPSSAWVRIEIRGVQRDGGSPLLAGAEAALILRPERCSSAHELLAGLRAPVKRVFRGIAHCVPDFVCKVQSVHDGVQVAAGAGRVIEVDAVSSTDSRCVSRVEFRS